MSASIPEGTRQIAVNDLALDQINQLIKQLEQEITFFGESSNSLKSFVQKNEKSIVALESLEGTPAGHSALIPLSESMYIRAELSDPSKMLVEIGTGYYAEIARDKAANFFERKKQYISTQLETIDKILVEKKKARAVLSDTLQQKIATQLASLPK